MIVANCQGNKYGNSLFSCDVIIFQNYKLSILLASVVQKVDNALHWINHYPADSGVVWLTFIHWMMIYPVDSVIQPSNNRGLKFWCHQK